jgi:hypothetical protein
MSDFDAALERLVSDPAFREALATDPGRALSGYQLSPDELELLESQVDTGTGGERHVEQRTSKASLFGLLSPMSGVGFADLAHGGNSGANDLGGSGLRSMHNSGASFGAASMSETSGASFGAPEHAGASFGADAAGASFSAEPGQSGASFGDAPEANDSGYRPRHGAAASGGLGASMGHAGDYMTDGGVDEESQGASLAPANYSTRVDANGDGRWDQFTAIDRGDQGVDLVVDRDGDGHAEFVGHDLDRDGLIDEASTDEDRDGVLDTRWVDNDGDGWLDARQAAPPLDSQRAYIRGENDPR